MNDELDLDQYDEKITNVLYDFPNGVGFNELFRRTGLPKKTLNNHLIHLERHGIIKKEKLLPYHSAPSNYTLLIDEVMRTSIDSTVKTVFVAINSTYGYSKSKQYEMFPFIAQILSNHISLGLVQYLLLPHGKALYQILLNKLEARLDEYKKHIAKNFSKNAKDDIYSICNTVVNPLVLAQHAVILGDIETQVNKRRTNDEIVTHMLTFDRNLAYRNYRRMMDGVKKVLENTKTPKDLKDWFDSLPGDLESSLKDSSKN